MPDDAFDENELELFKGSSKSFRRKANALVKGLRWVIRHMARNRRTPMRLYLNTDSLPVVVEVDGIVVDSFDGTNQNL